MIEKMVLSLALAVVAVHTKASNNEIREVFEKWGWYIPNENELKKSLQECELLEKVEDAEWRFKNRAMQEHVLDSEKMKHLVKTVKQL